MIFVPTLCKVVHTHCSMQWPDILWQAPKAVTYPASSSSRVGVLFVRGVYCLSHIRTDVDVKSRETGPKYY